MQRSAAVAPALRRRTAGGEAARKWLWLGTNFGLPALLILVPVAAFLVHSFWTVDDFHVVREFSLHNYRRFFAEQLFVPLFLKTCGLALKVTGVALVVGYPVAYFLALLRGTVKYAAVLLFVVPLLMSYIIKIYAIRSILGNNGFLNRLLVWLGILDRPTDAFAYNLEAVLITLVVLLLPLMILPIFVSLERMPRSLLEASGDLGATVGQTFLRIVLPLSLPGVVVGVSFTFILALGDFITPTMVGGMTGFTYGAAVFSQFGTAFDWPFGAMLSVMLLIVVLAAMFLAGRLGRPRGIT